MKKNILLMISALLCVFLFSSCNNEKPAPTTVHDITTFFPEKELVVANLLELKADARIAQITEKFQIAIQPQEEWFTAYVQANPNGPLPYHPNMGITQEEYKLLTEADKHMEYGKVDDIMFKVTDRTEFIELQFLAPYDNLGVIRFFTDENRIETPLGRLNTFNSIDNDDPNSPLGRWYGNNWILNTIEDPNNPEGIFIDFSIGQKKDKKWGLIYYDVRSFIPNSEFAFTFILEYPL